MVEYVYNLRNQEVKARGSLVKGYPGLHSEFKANRGYTVRPCLKIRKRKYIPYIIRRRVGTLI
jgi:hypothetical protein